MVSCHNIILAWYSHEGDVPDMMRSRTRIVALFTLFITCAVLLSGCIHADSDLKLNGDGSGSYTLTLGLSEMVVGLGGDTFVKSMNDYGNKVKKQGGDYRHFDKDGYSVWVYTRPFKNVNELNTLLHDNPGDGTSGASTPEGTLSVTQTSNFFVNTFHVTGHISLMAPDNTPPDEGGIDISSYMKDARESVSITMPGWISNYSAGGKVQGNTVTYTVHYNEEATIDVTGGGVNPTPIFIIGGAGLVIVLLVVGGIIFWRRRSRRALAAEPAPELVAAGAGSFSLAPDTSNTSNTSDIPGDSMPTVSEVASAPDQPPAL